jgi:hypothetical protein
MYELIIYYICIHLLHIEEKHIELKLTAAPLQSAVRLCNECIKYTFERERERERERVLKPDSFKFVMICTSRR